MQRILFLASAAVVVLLAAPTWAQEASPAPPPALLPTPPRPDVPAPLDTPERTALLHPYYVYESFGVNAITHTWAKGTVAESTTGPGDKVILFQQIGVGYWVHPNIRLQVTGIFAETETGLKPGAERFTLGGVIPCVFYTNGGFAAGIGPLFAPRAFGAYDFNFGIFSVASYGIKIPGGATLALAVQVPVMFVQKDSIAVTPAIILGERF
jgi:hypothetical protein